jgi:putative membrane protein
VGRETRNLAIILGVLVLIVLLGPLLGGGLLGWGGMMGPGMMGSPGGPGISGGWGWGRGLAMGLGWLAMLAFWGAVIVGIVLLVRALTGATTGPPPRGGEDALAIARRRYASGELTREQYEQLRQDLER